MMPGPFGIGVDRAAMRHAEADAPLEACGLVVGGGAPMYLPTRNVAADPTRAFRLSDTDIAAAGADMIAVVHSHPAPSPACPSAADMRQQIAMAVPWGIVPVGTGGDAGTPFWWGPGITRPPLLGRPYRHGVTDCYAIVRDWFQGHDIELDDVPRGWDWWSDREHPDLYETSFRAVGFSDLPRAQATIGDVLLLAVGRNAVVSHGAVIVEPGVMLHHLGGDRPFDPGRLSTRDTIARWSPHIRRVLRHRDG